MKAFFLLGSLNRGGTETLLLDVVRQASACGMDVRGAYRKGGALEADFEETGLMKQLAPGKNLIRYLFQLRKEIQSSGAMIVHAHQPIDALYAKLATLRLQKISVVLTMHGYDFQEKGLSNWILRIIIKRADKIIYVSKTQRDYYIEKYQLNSDFQRVVYNGISLEKMKETASGISIREELMLPTNIPLLGSVGNFNAVRDQLTICTFLHLLQQQNVDFRFLFIGRRVEGQEIRYDACVSYCKENHLSDKVLFLGGRSDVPALLPQLDAFVYSTDHDTFGIAVVEAMVAGIPVFVNDWGVMQEITSNGRYGSLYKSGDAQSLYECFHGYLSNPSFYHSQAEKNKEIIQSKFSIEAHIAQLTEVYQTLNK